MQLLRLSAVVQVIVLCLHSVRARSGYGPGEQDWGYVDIRPGAHMFYWLYYTSANVANYTERPLAIWLQGGPGASSTGYGNFEELGPLTLEGAYRESTWVKYMNVLFIDNPVGTGFSYVDNRVYMTAKNKEIAIDLVSFMKGFYKSHPEFERVPLHIFSESYGGKMAPEFALELYKAVQRNELKSNLTSVALGDPWTSPIDSMLAWAPYLKEMSIVDRKGYNSIMDAATLAEELVNAERWIQATFQFFNTEAEIDEASRGVDFYNVLQQTSGSVYKRMTPQRLLKRNKISDDIDEDRDQMLKDLMRGPVAKALNTSKSALWGEQSYDTFEVLQTDFMKPVLHVVNELLEKTTVQVAVFSGQLDLICTTRGTVNWIHKLDWSKKAEFVTAPRNVIIVDRILEGYEQSGGNLTMFWLNRAGHMAPADNPAGMSHVLKKLTNFG